MRWIGGMTGEIGGMRGGIWWDERWDLVGREVGLVGQEVGLVG